jgi:hypothetical protein
VQQTDHNDAAEIEADPDASTASPSDDPTEPTTSKDTE